MNIINVLAIGDVIGEAGCEFLKNHLPSLKRLYKIDFTVVNGENSAKGNGITKSSAELLLAAGTDVITTGNHAFAKHNTEDLFDENPFILRPANYPKGAPGRGYAVYDLGRRSVAVVNIAGQVFMEPLDSPFDVLDTILNEIRDKTNIILVDVHAEATSEKQVLGYYLDGRVSAVFGTHTHVLTADNHILPNNTGYITDIGMTGPSDSVIGVRKELALRKMKNKLPVRFEFASGSCILCGIIFEIDETTGHTLSTQLVKIEN